MARIVAENLERYQARGAADDLRRVFESVWWCPRCGIPLLGHTECPICNSTTFRCARDLKPVFVNERARFESLVNARLPAFLFINRNHVYFDGRRLFSFAADSRDGLRLVRSRLNSADKGDRWVHDEDYAQQQWNLCLRANRPTLERITKEAIDFILLETDRFSDRRPIISFSGGKDSAVTALLVQEALGEVPLLFGDTTIEFPPTYEYVEFFAGLYGFEVFCEKPDADFFQLCDVLEPPSRIMRWCCTVCKSRPINKFHMRYADKILSFDGIRRMESRNRANYPRVAHVQKFSRQISARPIAEWSSFAVWLFLLQRQVPYNPLYDHGYSRVGCMYCPSNTPYNELLTKEAFPDLYDKWIGYLMDYARDAGKAEPASYVLDGFWKSRKIGKKRDYVVERASDCQRTETVYSFASPIRGELIEFLKPFGQVSMIETPDSVCFFVGSPNPLTIVGSLGDSQLSVSFSSEHHHLAKLRVEKQIEKYLNCVHCGGCLGVCPNGAITIRGGRFRIDGDLCTRCRRCTTTKYLKEGCVALNFSATKRAIRRV